VLTGQCSVSAILPSFNSRTSIERAIESVLSQSSPHLAELIVVDDASADDTARVVAKRTLSDPRLRLVARATNGGPGAARNEALALARGTWIAPIDADDAWHRDRLSQLLPLATPQVDLIFDNLMGFDAVASCTTGPLLSRLPHRPSLQDLLKAQSGFNLGYAKPLMRRSFLAERGITYPELRLSEDLLLYTELLAAGAYAVALDAPLYIYTTPVGGKSGRPSPLSHSAAFDQQVAPALEALQARYEGALCERDLAAISERARYLRTAEGPALLHEAKTSRRWLRFAWLLLSRADNRRLLARRCRHKAATLRPR
jgi:succinoglycan biosynthesis protein ExoO